MKAFVAGMVLIAVCAGTGRARAQLQAVSEDEPQCVFAGSAQTISIRWRNTGSATIETTVRMRIVQLSSATATPVDEAPWKKLQSLPGQIIFETADLEFPPVKAESRFLVQWIDGGSNVLGSTEVMVYPTNLLAELGVLMGHADAALGVFDPENQLKPLLTNLKVSFVDLENTVVENFRGKLAVIGPFDTEAPARPISTAQIKTLSENGVAVVWIQSAARDSRSGNETPQPSFYSVAVKEVATVVVRPEVVTNLPRNPRSQLNLIYFCKLALHPRLPVLPETSPP